MKKIFILLFGIVLLFSIDINMPSMVQDYMKSGNEMMKNGMKIMNNVKDASIKGAKKMMSMGKELEKKMFKLYENNKLFSFNLRKDNVYAMDISPDGKYLVIGSDDSIVKVWDLLNGRNVKIFKVKKYLVDFIKITPDGKAIITTSDDNDINLWDLKTGKELKTFKNGFDGGLVNVIVLADNGKKLISGSDSSLVKIWDMKTGKVLKVLRFNSGMVTSLVVTPKGNIIAGNDDSTIKIWNIKTGKLLGDFKGSEGLIRDLFVSHDGKYLISIDDSSIRIWNIKSKQNTRTLFFPYRVNSVTLTPDHKNLVISDHGFKILNIETGKMKRIVNSKSYVNNVKLTPNNKYIVSANDDKTINIWSIAKGEALAKFISFFNKEWISIKSDGHYTASKNADKYVYMNVDNQKVPLHLLKKKLEEKSIKLKGDKNE